MNLSADIFSLSSQKINQNKAWSQVTGTPDLEVWGSSLPRRVVSLNRELYSTLSLFTQVYK